MFKNFFTSMILLMIFGIIGWIANLLQLINMGVNWGSTEFILKLVGLVLVPLGSILGWIGIF